ncbi:alpha/beta fold hydrolase [Microtetraspora malaysiensis]|uniref:alpha/beta fold hydrolase n=1 Tax=Microtetraspora malaysiensis TaxID=161358 RepID=UPI003D8F3BF6
MSEKATTTNENGRLGQSAAARDWVLDDRRAEHWPNMKVPALMVAFEHDIQFPPRAVRKAAEEWPGASYVGIAGVAHGNGAFDAATEIGQAVADFIATH